MKKLQMSIVSLFLIFLSYQILAAQAPGNIVFSKAPINAENPANLSTAFKSGDFIYAVAYFTKSLKQQCKGRISKNATKHLVEILMYKNGGYSTSMSPTLKAELFEGDKLLLDIVPKPSEMTAYTNPNLSWKMYGHTKEGPLCFAQLFGEFDPGKTTIKLEIKACYEIVASGEFIIEGDNFDFYTQLMEALQHVETKTVGMPVAKPTDPSLEKEMKLLLSTSSNDAWKGEILKVVIIDKDWFIERHKITGAILFRYIRAEVAVNKNDDCWLYHLVTFKQNYVGNKFEKTFWDGAGDRVNIPCENVK